MSSDDLIWVGSAPLSPEDMGRLRRDLILQRIVLWVPTSLILSISLLFYAGLKLSEPEAIATVSISFFAALLLARKSGYQRYRQIRSGLI